MSDARPWSREWLKGKTLADLQAIEDGGRLLFPDVIRRAKAGGKWEEVPIMVRIPTPRDKRTARLEAIQHFTKHKLDRDKDADLFQEVETLSLLSRIMHERKPPHDRFVAELDWLLGDADGERYDLPSLYDVWDRVTLYRSMIDPTLSEDEVTTDLIVQAALGVADSGNLTPFAGIGGPAQDACVIGMANLLARYLRGNLSGPWPGISTPEN